MNIDFEDAEVIALNALEHARSLAPGAARTEALKEAGKLRAAADRLWEIPASTSGRRSKFKRI